MIKILILEPSQGHHMAISPQHNFVIFLGAGFSVDAGLPTMSSFGLESRTDYNTLLKHASLNEKYAAQMLVDAANAFYTFQEFCKKSPVISSDDLNNFETVFCIVESMIEARKETITLKEIDYHLDKLSEQLQLWLWKIYQQSPTTNPDRRTHKQTYTDFFNWLHISNLWDRTIVVSTNYDLMFEYLTWEIRQQTCTYYPLEESVDNLKPIVIGDGINYFSDCKQNTKESYIPICKLHGSVNYFENKSTNGDQNLYISTDIGGKTEIGKSGTFDKLPAIFAVDAIWKIREDYGQTFTPAIIPPTYAKITRKPWLRTIWETAFDALSAANTILFIGYSMPETDGFLRALIHGAFAFRKDVRHPNVFVIDPESKVHKKYSDLFRDSYHDIGQHTLRKALEIGILNDVLKTMA